MSPPSLIQDTGSAWLAVAASFIHSFLLEGVLNAFGVFYTELIIRYGGSASITAWIRGLHMFVFLIMGPLASLLEERFGHRAVVVSGGALQCVAYILSAWAPHLYVLHLTFGVLAGVGSGLIYVPKMGIVTRHFTRWRGRAFSLALLGRAAGATALSPLLLFLIDTYSLSGAFLVLAGLSLHHLVAALLYMPRLQLARGRLLSIRRKITTSRTDEQKNNITKECEINTKPEYPNYTQVQEPVECISGGRLLETNEDMTFTEMHQSQGSIGPNSDVILASDVVNTNKGTYTDCDISENNAALQSANGRNSKPDHTIKEDITDSEMHQSQGSMGPTSDVTLASDDVNSNKGNICDCDISQNNTSLEFANGQNCKSETDHRITENITDSEMHHSQGSIGQNSDVILANDAVNSNKVNVRDYYISENYTSENSQNLKPEADHTTKALLSGNIQQDSKTNTNLSTLAKIKTYLHHRFHILRNFRFLLFCVHVFTHPFGISCIYVFHPSLAKEYGVPHYRLAFPIIALSVSSILGGLGSGLVFDISCIRGRVALIEALVSLLLGVNVILLGVVPYMYEVFMALTCLQGLLEGVVITQRVNVVAAYVGVEDSQLALGVVSLFQGVGNCLAPLALGSVKDNFGSYSYSYIVAGATIAVSSILLLVVYPQTSCSRRVQHPQNNKI